MSDIIWTIDEGLHEMPPDELRTEATSLVRRAQRAWNNSRRTEMMERAARMFREADENDADENDAEEKETVKRMIADEKDPYRKARMQEQAGRRWGG